MVWNLNVLSKRQCGTVDTLGRWEPDHDIYSATDDKLTCQWSYPIFLSHIFFRLGLYLISVLLTITSQSLKTRRIICRLQIVQSSNAIFIWCSKVSLTSWLASLLFAIEFVSNTGFQVENVLRKLYIHVMMITPTPRLLVFYSLKDKYSTAPRTPDLSHVLNGQISIQPSSNNHSWDFWLYANEQFSSYEGDYLELGVRVSPRFENLLLVR